MVYSIGSFRESPSTGQCSLSTRNLEMKGSCHIPGTNETDMSEVTVDMLVKVGKCRKRFIARVTSAGWKEASISSDCLLDNPKASVWGEVVPIEATGLSNPMWLNHWIGERCYEAVERRVEMLLTVVVSNGILHILR